MSHLGAVINFFAGSVQRAPKLAQRFGLEWLWRIYQEPALWRRYFNDGVSFLKLLLCNVMPYWIWLKFFQPTASDQTLGIKVSTEADESSYISLSGYCVYSTILPLREAFKKAATEKRDVVLDLKSVTLIDSAFLGLCLVLYKHLKASGHSLKLINYNKNVKRVMKWQKVNGLLA